MQNQYRKTKLRGKIFFKPLSSLRILWK